MTKDSIRQAALKRFAEQGFDGTSMAEIASDVGIKAPAIYAHFKGKTELFLDLLHQVIESEQSYAKQFLSQEGKTEEILLAFLHDMGERFCNSPDMRFLLNAAYLPPQKIYAQLAKPVQVYMEGMETILNTVFKLLPPCRIPPEQLASAYFGIMDSIQVEILYGGSAKFQKRLDALWQIFLLGLNRPTCELEKSAILNR